MGVRHIAKQVTPVPTTWNAGPRDENGAHGPYEASLLGNPVADAERPLEVLRTVHSFDPCLACAIHTFDPEERKSFVFPERGSHARYIELRATEGWRKKH